MFGGTNTAMPAKRKLAAACAVLLSVGIVATGCTSVPAPAAVKKDSQATVVRIVDGDTIVADLAGTETTIRLLNIDTPESKDPNEPVQCLGPEATEYLESLLKPGDGIDLEYDVQRLDSYGRTLAGVYKDDSLVNADIAAAGLGVAVLYQPNERFYAEVKAAEQSAAIEDKGLFSPAIDCTVPAMANRAASDLEALEDADPETPEAAGTALAVVTAAVLAGKAKKAALAALDEGEDGVASAVWAARKAKHLPRLDAALDRAIAMESRLATTRTAMQEPKSRPVPPRRPSRPRRRRRPRRKPRKRPQRNGRPRRNAGPQPQRRRPSAMPWPRSTTSRPGKPTVPPPKPVSRREAEARMPDTPGLVVTRRVERAGSPADRQYSGATE